jgi:hypothetical protein
MRQYSVINGITDTLTSLLADALKREGFRRVNLSAEIPKGENIKAKPSVFCYMHHIGFANQQYRERNQSLVTTHDDAGNVISYYQDAPLYLFANYLLTVFGTTSREENLLLGLTMKTFLEHPVLTGEMLKGNCFVEDDRLNIAVKHQTEYEEVLSFWRSINEEVRPTVMYHVRFRLESERTSKPLQIVEERVSRADRR